MAGLLGLTEAARDSELREAIGLGARSRVLAFNTEGATDPELYERIVGSPAGGAGDRGGGPAPGIIADAGTAETTDGGP